MYKSEKESDTWLDVLLEPQRAELPPIAWNQLSEGLGQSSPEELTSQLTSNDKTAFSKSLQRTVSTYFQNNQTVRNLEIQLQTILILRAKTRNNHLASDYVRELESDLFREVSRHSRQRPSTPKICDYKQKSGKHSLFECIRAQRPAVIKNFQFKARSWTVSQLLKEYGEKEFLLTQKGNTFKNLQLKEIKGNDLYLANSGRFTDNIPNFLAHFAPISCKRLWSRADQQTPRYLTSYQLFMSDHPELGTPCHNDLSGDCNLFFQIEGRKKWTLIDPNFTLMIYPVIPPEPSYGESLIDQYDMKPDPRARLFQYCPHQEVTLKPGDVLFIPPYYWHSVRNVESRTLAVATRWGNPLNNSDEWLETLSEDQIPLNTQKIKNQQPTDSESLMKEMTMNFERSSHQSSRADLDQIWMCWRRPN